MYENGFIKVDKGIRTAYPLFADGRALGAWTYLLILSSHAPREIRIGHRTLRLESGTLMTTTKELATALRYPERYVRELLLRMENEGLIHRQRCRAYTLITPCITAPGAPVPPQSNSKSRPAANGTAVGLPRTSQAAGSDFSTFDTDDMFRAAIAHTEKSNRCPAAADHQSAHSHRQKTQNQ